MPRKPRVYRRERTPDLRYHSLLVSKLINYVMRDGKQSVATSLVYEAMEQAAQRSGQDPLGTLEQVIKSLEPQVEVKARRIGGATYQVPIEVRGDRRTNLALQWLLTGARTRTGASFSVRLAQEMNDVIKGQGSAVKKREDTHRMAEANRAFAHFAW